jgi:tRNA(adenine34) deaminase
MVSAQQAGIDQRMMLRCLALAEKSGAAGEYPYAAVICRNGEVTAETTNRVAAERDVTRHAEVVALSMAQKTLDCTSLDDCTLYVNVEPCAYCSYAIRETRIGRVVYGLASPHMGGVSKWNVLADEDLSRSMPEVFASPPEIVADFMRAEAEAVWRAWNPLVWDIMRRRHIFGGEPSAATQAMLARASRRHGPWSGAMRLFRRYVADRFGR